MRNPPLSGLSAESKKSNIKKIILIFWGLYHHHHVCGNNNPVCGNNPAEKNSPVFKGAAPRMPEPTTIGANYSTPWLSSQ